MTLLNDSELDHWSWHPHHLFFSTWFGTDTHGMMCKHADHQFPPPLPQCQLSVLSNRLYAWQALYLSSPGHSEAAIILDVKCTTYHNTRHPARVTNAHIADTIIIQLLTHWLTRANPSFYYCKQWRRLHLPFDYESLTSQQTWSNDWNVQTIRSV